MMVPLFTETFKKSFISNVGLKLRLFDFH